ncbi:hypothetical protein RJ639_000123 [Escallonia herrerae]|uniref:O-acyltransferase WSD1 C-terminal domain-containing protein n=1 Tax=Escallonia herrerae TaxID=1293975 RepID=A0AA89BF71_9ASTE|nr:hypothetical protein RJ639_000123 [Escallonia herrerae]
MARGEQLILKWVEARSGRDATLKFRACIKGRINEIVEIMMALNTNYKDTGLFGVFAVAKHVPQKSPKTALQYEQANEDEKDEEATKARSHLPRHICLRAALLVNLRPSPEIEPVAALTHKIVSNTTMAFSNVVSPQEEISLFGHPVTYIAPTVYGHPLALTLHFQSYCDKVTISMAVDEDVIPDPHRLCNDLEESINIIKVAVLKTACPKNVV